MGLLNVTLQITAAQHHSVEKYVIRSIDGAGDLQKTELNYSDLTAGEKAEYDDVKSFCDAYISPKTAERITLQIDESEHRSQERLIITYDDSGETRLIKNYADLTAGEKTKYDAFKAQADSKIPA